MSSINNHNDTNISYRRILESSAKLTVPCQRHKTEAWIRLAKRLERATGVDKTVHLTLFWKVAASITLFVLTSFLIYNWQRVNIYVPRADQKLVYLPDGSSVHLNSDSQISYNQLFWKGNRTVFFSGEGIFDVKKGDIFFVESPSGKVLVKGTRFNVFDRKGKFKVACLSGQVQVTGFSKTKSVELTTGFSTQNGEQRFSTNMEKEISWTIGDFYFESTSLAEVLNTLEIQYDVVVHANEVDKNRVYTGYFSNSDLQEALKLICLPLELNYEIQNQNQIRIFQKELKV